MRAFGNYILSGRMQAIGVIGFLLIFSLLVPPTAFLVSGVPVALVTLRKGGNMSAQVIMGSLILSLGLTLVLNIEPLWSLVFLLTVWVPVWLCAMALRQTESPVAMALTAAGIAVAFILFMYAAMGDVEAWWRALLTDMLKLGIPAATSEQYQQAIEIAPALMNAVVASSIVLSLMTTVLIARWWQAALFNPGGFSKEFQAFCLPKQLALPTIVGVGLTFLENSTFGPILRDILVVIVILYLFQGIASVHRTVKQRALSRKWLVGMYCLLAFLPQIMIILVAWIGMTDSLIGGRKMSGGDKE
jgi:hypothetical protein